MIYVCLKINSTGVLCACEASGHADFAKNGHDIVCAAATVLLRTTVLMLEKDIIYINVDKKGFLSFSIQAQPECPQSRLQYAAEFLWVGLSSLQNEYPQCITCERVEQ